MMKNSKQKRLRDGVGRQPQKEIRGGFHSLADSEILVSFLASISSELESKSGIGALTSVSGYGYCGFVISIKKF
ncbi:hypothetical protein SLEP1_g19097 [Rubroshorea leprosula]|nr:hypothetical protein SLEP1_g19097 [Rubroshorea leprosula]